MKGIIEQAIAHVAVLPARVVYLIAAGSRPGFRRAVQEASCRWAGATELIVPVPASGRVAPAWKQMVEHGACDCLVNVDVADETAERAQQDLRPALVDLRHIDRSGASRWSTHPANVEDEQQRTSTPVMATRSDAALWELACTGDLTETQITDLQGQDFARRPRAADELGRAQLSGNTVLDRGLEQFGEHRAVNGPSPSPTFLWVTKPNSLKDCIWFWNCRALRPLTFDRFGMYLVPHKGLEHWIDFATQFQSTLARAADIEPDVVLCSLSVDEAQLRSVAHLLGLKASTKKPRSSHRFPPPPVRSPPFTYGVNGDPRDFVLFERQYGRTADAVIQVGTPRTLLRLESPVRFTGSGYVLLRVSSSALDHLPRVATAAELVLPNADWSNDALQIRTNANSHYHLELQVPDISDATLAVLHSATSNAELSDKGRIAHRVETLTEAPLVLEPGVLEVVSELTTPRSKELMRVLRELQSDGHVDTYLVEVASTWGGRTQRRYRSSLDLHGSVGEVAHAAAETLAAGGWAERGLEIRCSQCSIPSFVPLSDVTRTPICPSCSAPQAFELDRGPRVVYRLNGLVDRASDQGVVPHLMASAALFQRDPRTSLLLGVDARFKDGTEGEVDLFGLHGGKIVAGEAKSSPRDFTQTQLQRDVEMSQRLGAHLHLLASPQQIADETVECAKRLVASTGMKLVVIERESVRQID